MVMPTTSNELAPKEHPWDLVTSGSTVALEVGVAAMYDQILFNLAQQKCPYYLPAYRQIVEYLDDLPISSIQIFASAVEDDVVFSTFNEHIRGLDLLEDQIVVRMPAKRRYTIELEIRNVRRAEPNVVGP